jgi:hypothetical protein
MIHLSWKRVKFLAIDHLREKAWRRHILLAAVSTTTLIAAIPIGYILLLGEGQFNSLLLRYAPIALLALFVCGMGIRLEIFQNERNKWISVFLIALMITVAGFILQTTLLHGLGNPVGLKERVAGQAFSVPVYIAFGYSVAKLSRRERTFLALIVVLVTALLTLQWITLPNKLRWIKSILALYAALFILGLPLLAQYTLNGWSWMAHINAGVVRRLARYAAVGLLLLLAYFYYQTAVKHADALNVIRNSSDQAFYIKFIKDVYQSGFTSTGDHNRMPLYPYLQAFFYRDGMSNKELFQQGKHLNIILSLILLGALFLVFIKRFRFFQAFLLILVVAFSLYIFKAPYLQAEILFYTLSAIFFLLTLQMLLRPTWPLALATGLSAGLAYLTKGTILPGVFLFATIFGAKQWIQGVQETKRTRQLKFRFAINQTGYLFLFLAVFFLSIYPYARAMKQWFGSYFYNVNTTVYIWYENFDQALEEEAKYHFTERWPDDLAEDQTPGIRKYLREHTAQQILARFWLGAGKVLHNIFYQYGVTNYWLFFAAIFLIAILLDIRNSLRTARRFPYLILYIVFYFGGYLVVFTWYSHIAGGTRFLFGLYIPFLIVVLMFMNEMAKNQSSSLDHTHPPGSLEKYLQHTQLFIAFTLLYGIWLVLTRVMFFYRFGS